MDITGFIQMFKIQEITTLNFHYFDHICAVSYFILLAPQIFCLYKQVTNKKKDTALRAWNKSLLISSKLLQNNIPTSFLPEKLVNSNFNILALLNIYGDNSHDISNVPIVHKKSWKESI